MQRIDENTYIDDTLVTCAEYQLFIDEMREQGKYYQPDHWTSYQFPKGKAREPILGVRYFDAVDLCEWLTKRDGVEWKYRLPALNEANTFLTSRYEVNPLGYWLNKNYEFAWIGITPLDTHALDLPVARNIANDFRLPIAFDDEGRGYDLDRVRLDRVRAQTDLLVNAIHNAIISVLDRAGAPAPALTRAHDLASTLSSVLSSESELSDVFARSRSDILYIDTDLYILQERIAGRSPAFEGIRLVKERIK